MVSTAAVDVNVLLITVTLCPGFPGWLAKVAPHAVEGRAELRSHVRDPAICLLLDSAGDGAQATHLRGVPAAWLELSRAPPRESLLRHLPPHSSP